MFSGGTVVQSSEKAFGEGTVSEALVEISSKISIRRYKYCREKRRMLFSRANLLQTVAECRSSPMRKRKAFGHQSTLQIARKEWKLDAVSKLGSVIFRYLFAWSKSSGSYSSSCSIFIQGIGKLGRF